jgi:hypothetical protein
MFLITAGVLLATWMAVTAWKFYGTIDWDEPAEPSPDLRAMYKKEAELVHIAEILADAHREGKISAGVLEEFTRYAEAEIGEMKAIELAWKTRPRKNLPDNA